MCGNVGVYVYWNRSFLYPLSPSLCSGGTGLNIIEANHAAFVDRWFNPFVHEQAEDRMYRIGQLKDVNITYFDTEVSSDIVRQE